MAKSEIIDFSNISKNELDKLEAGRKKTLQKCFGDFFGEHLQDNPIVYDLRHNFGYVHIAPFLIQGQTGAKFELSFDKRKKEMRISYIGVLPDSLRQGQATRMMTELMSAVDRCGYKAWLDIDTKFGLSEDVLIRFYKKFGFMEVENCKGRLYRNPRFVGDGE
jgi:ribosomal protein S18 acetylase RimI-like enzyme